MIEAIGAAIKEVVESATEKTAAVFPSCFDAATDGVSETKAAGGQELSSFPVCFSTESTSSAEGISESAEKVSPTEGMSIEKKQAVADAAAQEYNDKYKPVERAISKGYDDVTETPNGGVSFENSQALYVDEDGRKGIVSIEATGKRTFDFDSANKQMGFSDTPDGYVWHHMDDYDVASNRITMQLVKDEAHNATKPHSGGCAQYDAVNGQSYNKKGV